MIRIWNTAKGGEKAAKQSFYRNQFFPTFAPQIQKRWAF